MSCSDFSGPRLKCVIRDVKLLLSSTVTYTDCMSPRLVRLWLTTSLVWLYCYTALPCEDSPRSLGSNSEQCGLKSNPLIDNSLRNALRTTRAVEPMHVQNAFCKLPAPTEEGMKRWLKNQPKSEIETALNALIPSSQRAVRGCADSLCKAEKIFGGAIGIKLLYLQSRYKLNGSHLTNENASAWSDTELQSILLAVQDFPERDAKFGRPLVRYTRGRATSKIEAIQDAHPGVCIPSTDFLQFFDCFFTFGDEDANRATVFHELSHAIGERNNLERSSEWLEISKWNVGADGKPVPGREDCFISVNGMANPEEDFADAMMAYRYDPAGLMSACPAKYEFIKSRVFHGTEYTSATSCTQ
jgi:hypothetical protein